MITPHFRVGSLIWLLCYCDFNSRAVISEHFYFVFYSRMFLFNNKLFSLLNSCPDGSGVMTVLPWHTS